MQILSSLSSCQFLEELRLAGYKNVGDASLVPSSSTEPLNVMALNETLNLLGIGEGKLDSDRETAIGRIPVVSKSNVPLMPCRPTKARKLLAQGKAIKKRNKLGVFYLHLQFDPQMPVIQPLAVGVDPGTQFEGFSVVGKHDTVVNIMSESVTWVKQAIEKRRNARRARRNRKTRRRKCKKHRRTNQSLLPPSTKARWDVKLRIIRQLCKILPLRYAVVEDIRAVTKKNQQRWNRNFSPLEVGKNYFYSELKNLGLIVILAQGNETKRLRELFGLKKRNGKSIPVFETHCIDAWVLATAITGALFPTTKSLYYIVPLQFHRRQLHRFKCSKGGVRRRYGGTMSLDLKKGTLIRHKKHGLCYIGGNRNNRLSLHCYKTGKRISRSGKKEDFKILTKIPFRTQFIPLPKQGIQLR
ncbi:RRXRR domain-containing protein [Candidatus Borrarchaeum sp.]|uniref:RRXRR domain-containing protein n=1 Tax=Candidatus Borrarchaeum sp. TaxID=2846742 RepID=UPI002580B369|nr:RRXRR domain-containing protein [Candidatus Borrarchaeum sp.]